MSQDKEREDKLSLDDQEKAVGMLNECLRWISDTQHQAGLYAGGWKPQEPPNRLKVRIAAFVATCWPATSRPPETVDEASKSAQAGKGEPVAFLANGTRFKMAFHDNADDLGNLTGGTHVTCFSNFAKELDGRWVALVAAEDDQHLRLQQPALASPPSREPLTEEQIDACWDGLTPSGYGKSRYDIARAIERAHGIHSRGEGEKA